jgi:heptaprenyl diphosphate synthase
MQLPRKKEKLRRGGRILFLNTYDIAIVGIFLAFILVVGLIERMIPLDSIVPGIRLGLSNVVILTSIYLFRFRSVFLLVILKCLLLALLTGGVTSFLYGICGSILSFLGMWCLVRILGDKVSPIGVSVVGAVLHISGQLLVAALILESLNIFTLLPLMLILSAATGVLTGLLVRPSLAAVRRLQDSNGVRWRKE